MTPSQLKYKVDQTGSHFFTRASMKYFGDTMKNFGLRSYDENTWELYRKSLRGTQQTVSFFFDKTTFKRKHMISDGMFQ